MQDFGSAMAPQARAAWRAPQGAAKRPPDAPRVVGGRYQLLDLLGRGGMGTVYRAIQQGLDRHVALKLLPRPRGKPDARQREMERRFETEARFAAQLSHPHAVQIIDVGRDRQHLFLAMEWIRGESLHRLMRQTRLSPDVALEVARQVGSAVSAAHELGALHRDLKPGNIMMQGAHQGLVGTWGRPWAKLLDFGLAKQFAGPIDDETQIGRKLGSPGYMAPEQVLGHPVDARSDVYGLGAVLFEMLSGRPAYTGVDANAIMRAHVEMPAPSLLSVSSASIAGRAAPGLMPMPRVEAEALDALVQRALAKQPEHRFATMASMVAAIEALQEGALRRQTWRAQPVANEQTICMPLRPEPSPSGRRHTTPVASMRPPVPVSTTAQPSEAPAAWSLRSRSAPWLLGLLGAAIGVVGGASLRHTPRWQLESLPRDAAVFWNDQKVCDKTPCYVQWQAEDIGSAGTLRFVRSGFDDVVTGRRIGRFNQSLAVTLEASEPKRISEAKEPASPR